MGHMADRGGRRQVVVRTSEPLSSTIPPIRPRGGERVTRPPRAHGCTARRSTDLEETRHDGARIAWLVITTPSSKTVLDSPCERASTTHDPAPACRRSCQPAREKAATSLFDGRSPGSVNRGRHLPQHMSLVNGVSLATPRAIASEGRESTSMISPWLANQFCGRRCGFSSRDQDFIQFRPETGDQSPAGRGSSAGLL